MMMYSVKKKKCDVFLIFMNIIIVIVFFRGIFIVYYA